MGVVIGPELLARFTKLVDPAGAIPGTAPEAQAYLTEDRGRWPGTSPLILRPRQVSEVEAILRLAYDTGTPIVPQGGNTGLVGGQTPLGGEVVLSLTRMDRIRALDVLSDSIVVEAGVVLAKVQEAALAANRLFPLSLASQGSATIGGLIAANAGGTQVLRYGTMRHLVLGLEVVLADGTRLDRLQPLRKDNLGFDLKGLFIGSEGRLGVITAASLALYPKPSDQAVALVALGSLEAALDLLARAKGRSSGRLSAFELIPRRGLAFLRDHARDLPQPFSDLTAPWYALLEITGGEAPGTLSVVMESMLAEALADHELHDAVIAKSLAEGAQLWALRERLPSIQKREGGSIKHDISVPVHKIPIFIAEACAAVEALCPGCRPVPFGHVGDGNIHFNVSQPLGFDTQAFLNLWDKMNAIVHAIARQHGGSISAEHGIGQAKIGELEDHLPQAARDVIAKVKAALDPKGILNPGKVLKA